MVLQLVLNGINIVLDLVFVLGLGLAIEGVAWATLIAEIAAAALGLALAWRVLRGEALRMSWPAILRRERLAALVRVNGAILIRSICLLFCFSYFTAQAAAMGDILLAANAVLMQFQFVSAYAMDGFAHAVEVLSGNALGRRSRADFRRAVQVSTLWALGFAILSSLIFWLMGEQIIALFSDITEVRTTAIQYLPWMIVSPLISVWSFQLDGIFVGTTRSAEMRNAMIASLAVYLAACWLLIPAFGNHGLWLALMVFMVARMVTLGLYFPRLERAVAGT